MKLTFKIVTINVALFSGLSLFGLSYMSNAAPIRFTTIFNKIEVGESSDTEPPDNTTTSLGSLDPSDPCNTDDIKLTALVPPNNGFSQLPQLANVPVLTVSAQPTLLFYVPYATSEVRYGELSIAEWPDERSSPPYQMRFTLPQQAPGIVSITPDPASGFSLEVEKDYRWRMRLYCGPGDTASDYVIVRGTIRRIAASQDTEAALNEFSPDIWYDSIAQLANQLPMVSTSTDTSLAERWLELIELLELEDSDSEPLNPDALVGPVVRIE